jgi:glycerophosphoryl diester phosphodiesterase
MTATRELLRNRKIPLILAHRGSQIIHNYPENSIPAFQEAVELGADGFELDIRLTQDNQLAIFHDMDLFRMAGKHIKLINLHSGDLPGIPIIVNKSEVKIYIPLLSQLFRIFGDSVIYNIEIKKAVRHYRTIIKALWILIEAYQLQDRVWLSSFDPIFLWKWNRQGYGIPTGYLFEAWNLITKFFCKKWFISFLHPNSP